MNQEKESRFMSPVKDPTPLILTTIGCIAMIVSTTLVWHLDGIPGSIFFLTDWADTPVSFLWFVIAMPVVMLTIGNYFAKSYIKYDFKVMSASLVTSLCLTLPIIAISNIIV